MCGKLNLFPCVEGYLMLLSLTCRLCCHWTLKVKCGLIKLTMGTALHLSKDHKDKIFQFPLISVSSQVLVTSPATLLFWLNVCSKAHFCPSESPMVWLYHCNIFPLHSLHNSSLWRLGPILLQIMFTRAIMHLLFQRAEQNTVGHFKVGLLLYSTIQLK